MNSRLRFLAPAVLLGTLCVAGTGLALEKTAARMTDITPESSWRGTSTCSVSYFNVCTAWIWIWDGWSPNDRFGVTYDSCCPDNTSVTAGEFYVWSGSPSGYGFTGAIELYDADAMDCPTGAALASVPHLPVTGFNTIPFGGSGGVAVSGSFSVVMVVGAGPTNPLAMVTDHPAAGPTGPAACGSCFPTTRETHSYYWGTASTPLCPGSGLFDGVCNAEFANARAYMACTTPVTPTSWGSVKNLYR